VKSAQIEKHPFLSDEEKAKYSDLQVLRSQAGWYVGTLYEDGTPGSRDSGYCKSWESADRLLKLVVARKIGTRLEP